MRHVLAVLLLCLAAFAPEPIGASSVTLPPVLVTLPHGGGGGGLTCPANDGSAGAPNASPAQPTLLNGYTKTITSTLGCKVAGVSAGYGVGITTGTSLTDWRTLSGTGITVNTGTGIVTYGAGSTCDAENIDFSLGNGAWLYFHGCTNQTAKNNKFICGSLCISNMSIGIITVDSCSGNTTITDNFIDGGSQNSNNQSTVISVSCTGSGTTTIAYNQIQNYSQHVLEYDNSGTLVMKWNFISNGAMTTGGHLNYLQLASGTYSIDVEFNTSYQALQISSGEGYQYYNGTGGTNTISGLTVRYNTMIADSASASGAMSNLMHGLCHSVPDCATTLTILSGSANIDHNFFDPTGTITGTNLDVFYASGGSAMWTGISFSNNWNMDGTAITNAP